jgi:hypothetical protein
VLTAIAVAKDLTPADAAAGRSAGVERGVCARALGTARRAPRCLRTGAHDGLITLRR